MLEKTIPLLRLTVAPLVSLGGVLAKAPAAGAVPAEDDQAPLALKAQAALEADSQHTVVMPTPESVAVPTFSTARVQRPEAAGLVTLPSVESVTTVDAVAPPRVSEEATPLEPKTDVRLTLERLLAEVDAPTSTSAELPSVPPEGPLSGHAADLELPDNSSLGKVSSPEADEALPLVAQDVDRETLCRSFPLNSRCREPVETEVESPIPVPPSTTESEGVTEATTNPADRGNGLYLSVFGALQGRADAQDFLGRASFSTGVGVGGALGYRLDDFRVEAEIGYFRNDFDELTFFIPGTTTPVPGPSETSPGAHVEGRTLMANFYYDIPLRGRLKPYIGAGVGIYSADIVDLAPPSFFGFTANGHSPDRFAFQLRAGLTYAMTQDFDVFLGYRYFKGNRFEYTIENSGSPPLVLRPNGLESHNLELGLRYNF